MAAVDANDIPQSAGVIRSGSVEVLLAKRPGSQPLEQVERGGHANALSGALTRMSFYPTPAAANFRNGLDSAAARQKLNDENDERHHEQEVNKAAETSNGETEQPENENNRQEGPKHRCTPSE
jgi:hypothetical protein